MEVLEFVRQYWAIIIGIIAFIATFANLKTQNIEQERRIILLEKDNCSIKENNTIIQTALAKIQVDIQWIKEALSKK